VIVKALNFAAEGKVKAIIETQPLESINDVFERLKAGKVNGRVVLTIGVQAPWVGRPHHPHEGAGVGGAIAKSGGAFFFIWTLLALGVTALFSVILAGRGLWEHLPRPTAAQHKQGASA